MQRLYIFLRDESGPTAVEYAVILALILMVIFTAVALVGTNTSASFSHSNTVLSSAGLGK